MVSENSNRYSVVYLDFSINEINYEIFFLMNFN